MFRYTASSFTLANDGHGGTTVVDPPLIASLPHVVSPIKQGA